MSTPWHSWRNIAKIGRSSTDRGSATIPPAWPGSSKSRSSLPCNGYWTIRAPARPAPPPMVHPTGVPHRAGQKPPILGTIPGGGSDRSREPLYLRPLRSQTGIPSGRHSVSDASTSLPPTDNRPFRNRLLYSNSFSPGSGASPADQRAQTRRSDDSVRVTREELEVRSTPRGRIRELETHPHHPLLFPGDIPRDYRGPAGFDSASYQSSQRGDTSRAATQSGAPLRNCQTSPV